MVVRALKWIGSIIGAAVAGAIVSEFAGLIGASPYVSGVAAGVAMAGSLYTLKPSPMIQQPTQEQRTQSARRYRKARSARRAQNR